MVETTERERWLAAVAALPPAERPRTRHRAADGRPRHVNRLALEPSPYLRQHAANPVDWRPWGPAAFAEAARLDRPIFLSVGYATCHWCHVMEEESFDDEVVAEALSAGFVAVKVDREQLPDVDAAYMLATQLMASRGGWPNSLWLTPDGRPFFAGTYFPKPQFLAVLAAVREAWEQRRPAVEAQAGKLAEAIAMAQTTRAEAAEFDLAASAEARVRAAMGFARLHNPIDGGFSQGTQFPNEPILLFLLDADARGDGTGPRRLAREVALRTLGHIEAGGIHDHVQGGFHRYAVDVNWRTPHFEKMLYNQAQLLRAFLAANAVEPNPRFERAARRIVAYCLRDMRADDGAFFAAEDADSPHPGPDDEKVEGAFQCWTPEQAAAALGAQAEWTIETLGLRAAPTGETGAVAHLRPGAAVDLDRLDAALERLRLATATRPRPLRDAKVIAGWNGLMIRALAEAATALDDPALLAAAERAAEAVWRRLWRDDRLTRFGGADPAEIGPDEGRLDDHVWLGLGALALWDATGASVWRDRAAALGQRAIERFQAAEGDPQAGRCRLAAEPGPLGPVYEGDDGATPAAESSALELFGRLARRSGDPAFSGAADRLLAALSGALVARPTDRAIALTAAAARVEGEIGPVRAAAEGSARIRARREGGAVVVEIRPSPGWRVERAELSGALGGAATRGDGADRVTLRAPLSGEHVALTLACCEGDRCLAPDRFDFLV